MVKYAYLTLIGGFMLLSGCIAIPIPTGQEAPFQQKDLPELVTGESTRFNVLSALGEPNAVYDDERLFLYTKVQTHFVWLVAIGAYYTAEIGILPGAQTSHYLGAWFGDGGRLRHLEAIPLVESVTSAVEPTDAEQQQAERQRSTVNCFRNGFCFATEKGDTLLAPPGAVKAVSSSTMSTCRLTLFVDCGPECEQDSIIDPSSVKLRIDGRPIGPHLPDGYYEFNVRPGRHILAAVGRKRGFFVLDQEIEREIIACKSPAPLHLKIILSSKKPGAKPFEFDPVGAEAAKAATAPRRLLLKRWQSENFPTNTMRNQN